MWTNENRPKYNRDHLRYPSDLTDDEWAHVEPLIPPAKPGGGKRRTDMRAVMNGVMYILVIQRRNFELLRNVTERERRMRGGANAPHWQTQALKRPCVRVRSACSAPALCRPWPLRMADSFSLTS
jgi:hypothetical protein